MKLSAFMLILLILLFPGGALAAPADDAERSDALISAGEVSLAATLYRPAAETGDLPTVIIGHGSAPSTREMLRFYINIGLRMAFAVLAFDKRGTGASTGEFEPFSVENSTRIFQESADDIVHAARWLAAQPGIDERRIGLLGGSQAGWVMPLAASREPLLRFIVVGAGVPLSAGQADIQQTYLNAVNNVADERFPLRQIFAADVSALDYRGPPGFDPSSVLQSLEIPVLWIFGLFDYFIPTLPSIERIGELQRGGRRNHHIRVLTFSDHNFSNVFTSERYDLTETITPWLRDLNIIQ